DEDPEELAAEEKQYQTGDDAKRRHGHSIEDVSAPDSNRLRTRRLERARANLLTVGVLDDLGLFEGHQAPAAGGLEHRLGLRQECADLFFRVDDLHDDGKILREP